MRSQSVPDTATRRHWEIPIYRHQNADKHPHSHMRYFRIIFEEFRKAFILSKISMAILAAYKPLCDPSIVMVWVCTQTISSPPLARQLKRWVGNSETAKVHIQIPSKEKTNFFLSSVTDYVSYCILFRIYEMTCFTFFINLHRVITIKRHVPFSNISFPRSEICAFGNWDETWF